MGPSRTGYRGWGGVWLRGRRQESGLVQGWARGRGTLIEISSGRSSLIRYDPLRWANIPLVVAGSQIVVVMQKSAFRPCSAMFGQTADRVSRDRRNGEANDEHRRHAECPSVPPVRL